MKKITWRDKPKIINTIPSSLTDDKIILFLDESGTGNEKTLRNAFKSKISNSSYSERNDLYLLSGVAIAANHYSILCKKFNALKNKTWENGTFNYSKYGERPINFRNRDMASKNPPFDNMTDDFQEKLFNIISSTKYVQISSGLNYYMYTRQNKEKLNQLPILMALGIIIVNYAEYLNSLNSKGIIIFEEESIINDDLKLKYILKLLKSGNRTHNKNFFKCIKAVYFRKKWTVVDGKFETTAGLELADLTASPFRRILHPEYMLVEKKFYKFPEYLNKGISLIR